MKRPKQTPLQKEYAKQVKRINKEVSKLRKQGVDTSKLEREIKSQIENKRATAKGVEKLKKEYTAKKILHKAGYSKTKQGIKRTSEVVSDIIQKAHEREQKKEAKKQARRDLQKQTRQRAKKQSIGIPRTQTKYQPPLEGELIFDNLQKKIDATSSKGADILEYVLTHEIEKYGRDAVTKALAEIPQEYIERVEKVLHYSDDSKVATHRTVKNLAEMIKSRILEDNELKDLTEAVDDLEEEGLYLG